VDRSWLHEHPEPGMRPAAIAADEARYERRRAAAEDPPPYVEQPEPERSHECRSDAHGRCRVCGEWLDPLPGGD
jgi:hypothetical protein